MRRRRFVLGAGTAFAAGGLLSTLAVAREEGHLPNDNVPHSVVTPFPGDHRSVPAGDWLVHRVGWVDEGETGREDIEAFLDAIDLDA